MSGKTIQTQGRGWNIQHTEHIQAHLPPHQLADLLPFDELTHEDLPYIRKKVWTVYNNFGRMYFNELEGYILTELLLCLG